MEERPYEQNRGFVCHEFKQFLNTRNVLFSVYLEKICPLSAYLVKIVQQYPVKSQKWGLGRVECMQTFGVAQ